MLFVLQTFLGTKSENSSQPEIKLISCEIFLNLAFENYRVNIGKRKLIFQLRAEL